VQGGETHAYAISVELRAVLRAVLQPPARIGWTISVPAISNPSDPAVWPLWRIARDYYRSDVGGLYRLPHILGPSRTFCVLTLERLASSIHH
jgi:hypothetical protein